MASRKYVQKPFLEGKFYVRFKFSCVRSSHDLCARAQLRGSLLASCANLCRVFLQCMALDLLSSDVRYVT